MTPNRILVSDIDGTLLNDGRKTEGLDRLRHLLLKHRDDVALVYATGRSLDSVWQLVQSDVLPLPDAIAPSIGTEIWFPNWKQSDKVYETLVSQNWDRGKVLTIASQIPGLTLQSDDMQTPHKVSFEVRRLQKVMDLRMLLESRGIHANIIYSCGKYLDVLPAKAGKKAAVTYLSQVWRVPPDRILTSGDSGNDIDMLTNPVTSNVLVANAENEMAAIRLSRHVYQANRAFAAGVLEGTEAFSFWP